MTTNTNEPTRADLIRAAEIVVEKYTALPHAMYTDLDDLLTTLPAADTLHLSECAHDLLAEFMALMASSLEIARRATELATQAREQDASEEKPSANDSE
jgi:F420-dependent methylenetetrahydromethanopterin dehydrogenase